MLHIIKGRKCWWFVPLLFVLPGVWVQSCSNLARQTNFEVLALSKLPDPKTVPYPNGSCVCRCLTENGVEILVCFLAYENREFLPAFLELKVEDRLSATLIPWAERPQKARAVAVANDFEDQFELQLFWAETYREVN